MSPVVVPPDVSGKKHRLLPGYAIGLFAALVLYVLTVAPGPLWQDSGMAQVRVLRHDLFGSLGLALSHPLYYLLAIAFQALPFTESAFKTNLVSAVFGAITVANTLLVIRLVTGRWQGAVVGAVSLAVAHTFWQHCALAEVYSVTTTLLSAELLCFLAFQRTRNRGWLILLFFVNGLGISNHLLASLSMCCWVGWYLIQVAQRKSGLGFLGLLVAAWLAGAALYAGLIIVRLTAGDGFVLTMKSAMFGEYGRNVTNLTLSTRLVLNSCLYLGLNFPTPVILLGLLALRPQRQEAVIPGIGLVLVLLVVYLIWAVRYNVPDQYTFFIPALMYMAVLIGVGANRLLTAHPRWIVLTVAGAALPALVYIPLPQLAEHWGVNLGLSRRIPYRDEYRYFLHPWKTGYRGPSQFAGVLKQMLPDGAVLIGDTTAIRPIHYQQISGAWNSSVAVYPPTPPSAGRDMPDEASLKAKLVAGQVFVVTPAEGYCPDWLISRYAFEPFGPIFRVAGLSRTH